MKNQSIPARTNDEQAPEHKQSTSIDLIIYVGRHCTNCDYAYQVAETIRQAFVHVQVRIVDLENATEAIPEAVFATPTYLLNGRVWSLGNPSPQKVFETFALR